MPSRSPATDLDPLEPPSALAPAAARLFYLAATEQDEALFLRDVLPLLLQPLGSESVRFVEGAKGRWQTIAASGTHHAPPDELLAKALDVDRPVQRGPWSSAPGAPACGAK